MGKDHHLLSSVGHQKIVVLPFSLTTVALNWRLQGDLAGLPSEYSTVLRSSRTTSGLFSTTFNSNWKVNAVVGPFIGWWEFHWHPSSPTWFTGELLVFFAVKETTQKYIFTSYMTGKPSTSPCSFLLGLFCNRNVGNAVLEPVRFIILSYLEAMRVNHPPFFKLMQLKKFFFNFYLLIYFLAALGLSCSTRNLR